MIGDPNARATCADLHAGGGCDEWLPLSSVETANLRVLAAVEHRLYASGPIREDWEDLVE